LRNLQAQSEQRGDHQSHRRTAERHRAEQPQCLVVHDQRGVPVAVGHRARTKVLDEFLQAVGIAQPQHVSFVTQRPVGHPPALVERSDEVFRRHPHVVEEDLVEVPVILIARRRERPSNHAGKVGWDHQRADALVLGGVWIGANKSQQNVGVMGTGCPHLLAVDHEVVTIAGSTGAQRGQIGTGAWLAHSERRGHLGPQDRHRPPTLLLRRSEGDQGSGDDADTLRIERQVGAPACEFLLMDVLLQQRGVSAAELGRESWQQPAVVEHQPLPPASPFRDMAARSRALERVGLGRQICVKKCHEFRAEGLDVSVEGQLHGAPRGKKSSKTSVIYKMRILFS